MKHITKAAGRITLAIGAITVALLAAQRLLVVSSGEPGFEPILDVVVYILVSAALLVNRHDPGALNIDPAFAAAWIAAGLLYGLLFGGATGIVLGLVASLNLIAVAAHSFDFPAPPNISWQLWLLVGLFLLQDAAVFLLARRYGAAQNSLAIASAVFVANPIGVLFEEAVFRGVLWSILRRASITPYAAVAMQAAAFWIMHVDYLRSKPLTFWVFLPISALLLGLIAWKGKSIMATSSLHYVHNLIVALLY
jgi:membrane protease YdiL (CAAX protease family)